MPSPGDDRADDEPSPSDDGEEDASDRPGNEQEANESRRRDGDPEEESRSPERLSEEESRSPERLPEEESQSPERLPEEESRSPERLPEEGSSRPERSREPFSRGERPDEGAPGRGPAQGSGPNDETSREPRPAERSTERPRGRADSRRGDQPRRDEWRRDPHGRGPPPERSDDDSPSDWRLFAYDVVSSVLAVAVIGAYLFAVSGVWPPLVAVESGSMEPNMQVNDLVFVMEEERFPGPGAHPTGVVTARAGERVNYKQFNNYGDVIVYHPNGNEETTPIIHRAMFWVEEGDNWCGQADPSFLGGLDASDDRCIADHNGFITKGDNNARYDQAQRLSGPVKPEWVVGTAEVRAPGLGWIRLNSAG